MHFQVPRLWAVQGHEAIFGDATSNILWRDAGDFLEEVERTAAIRQHQAAALFSGALSKGGVLESYSREGLSRRLGHSDDYLHRTLKGTRWATVQDLVALAQAARNADILTGGLATETLATELLSMAWPLPGDASPR